MTFIVKAGKRFSKGVIIGEHETEGEALNQALSVAPTWNDWERINTDKALYRWEDGPDFVEIHMQREAEE